MRIYNRLNDIRDPDDHMVESAELQAVMATLNKTMSELDKKKKMSADILMDLKNLQKRVEKLLKKPVQSRYNENTSLDEKYIRFGKSGTIEMHDNHVVIKKDGKTMELSKNELKDLLDKVRLK